MHQESLVAAELQRTSSLSVMLMCVQVCVYVSTGVYVHAGVCVHVCASVYVCVHVCT